MSNVDTVSSLPAALDLGQSNLPANVNQTLSGPPSPKGSVTRPAEEDAPMEDPVGGGDGPSSPRADSEAETIIQSGRESLSPEKRRRHINHDLKRPDDQNNKVESIERDGNNNVEDRREVSAAVDDSAEGEPDGRPSSLPEKPASPSAVKVEKPDEPSPQAPKPDHSHAPDAVENSEEARSSRKRSFSESFDGDRDRSRVNQQQPSSERDVTDTNNITLPRLASHDRSVSPVRSHKRTVSGPPGEHPKRKKVPAPLVTAYQRHTSEDRQSNSSSASGSPLPSSHLRRLAYVDGASASPVKPMAKKQRDQNGRTRLARACAAQEFEAAKVWLAERPEDLNVCDNAGNTPLQIASLEGCLPIVKILLDAGCEIETKNIDKDTPLIDAVENGHLEVVKVLLEAGANPRTVNAEGDEPYELVPNDIEECDAIRRAIANAKKASSRPSRRSEDHTSNRERSRRPSAASPRESPPSLGPRSPPQFGTSTKRKTVRSEATRNDLLWTKATPENLQNFAAKGDIAGVANILNVGQKADAESTIAATKGGHDEVLSLLFGMGDANPDPNPVQGHYQKPGYNTPMLAAIGRGNTKVIKLLLDQPGFNPTRRMYKDRTYFELSKERKAENWEEEYELLKDAYDNASTTKKHRKSEVTSPRRARKDNENKLIGQKESTSPVARPRKSSPSAVRRDALNSKNRSVKKSQHDDSSDSDIEPRQRARRDSDSVSRNGEAPKRKRLIPGRPPQDRDGRRPSQLSSDSVSADGEKKPRADSPPTAPPSRESKLDGVSLKRIRQSESPDRFHSNAEDTGHSQELQKKKRRVLSEDGAMNKTNGGAKQDEVGDKKPHARQDADATHQYPEPSSSKGTVDHNVSDDSVVKEERAERESQDIGDIPMEDVNDDEARAKQAEEAEQRRQEEAKKAEEERVAVEKRRVEEERLAEERRVAAEAERARIAKEEAERSARLAREKAEEDDRKRREAEQRRAKQAEDERQKRLEQERLRLEKLRREQEEQERRRRDALPSALGAAAKLIGSSDPRARSSVWLTKFMPVVTAETKQLDPSCESDVAREKWVPNYLVAPLLATNDLELSQCKFQQCRSILALTSLDASWEKRKATPTQRMNLWRVTRRMLIGSDSNDFLGSSFGHVARKDFETRPKYFNMEHVFWVRVSTHLESSSS